MHSFLMLVPRLSSFESSSLTCSPSSCICDVSICVQLPSGSCLVFARHKPYWPPGAPLAPCLSQGRSRLVHGAVSCSLHRWHPSPTTALCGSVSAHLTGVRASERLVWQPARTETGLLGCTWAVLDAASQLGRKQMNTNYDWHQLHENSVLFVSIYCPELM